MIKPRPSATSKATPKAKKKTKEEQPKETGGKAARETIESIVVAVILAFLFRAFIAEAFVIPTGSMAPTLQGRHMDVECEKCEFPYRTGASCENEDRNGEVVKTTCPICRYTMTLNKSEKPNQRSFNGDRILVSKFTYELSDPERFDVIVFKYPGNAKQNYIKRLVGKPNETIWIRHGDIYVRNDKDSDAKFRIVRKPPFKLKAMLQLVDDTDYRAPQLVTIGWPPRWQDWRSPDAPAWRQAAGGRGFETSGQPEDEAWLRYRHVVPLPGEWDEIGDDDKELGTPKRLSNGEVTGQLIADYYEYNDGDQTLGDHDAGALGRHWVGDLAIECDVDVKGDSGQLSLDLVKGGVHYTCRIDVATGQAVLSIKSIDEGRQSFVGDDGTESQNPKATTKIRAGSYRLRYSNCDDELLLWVNNREIEFDGPTTYKPAENVKPKWSPADAGDLEPAGVGAKGVAIELSRLRVYRDVYYVAVQCLLQSQIALRKHTEFAAVDHFNDLVAEQEILHKEAFVYADRMYGGSQRQYQNAATEMSEAIRALRASDREQAVVHQIKAERALRLAEEHDSAHRYQEDDYVDSPDASAILKILRSPDQWSVTSLFDSRRQSAKYRMEDDEFFPMGDNSPQSRDARVWSRPDAPSFSGKPPEPYVRRDLLTGKALLIYWPHAWRRPIPFTPNVKRMGLIR